MKNKLALFDMDGTLFDTCKANYLAYKYALNQYNYNMTYEYFVDKAFGKNYKEFLPPISTKNEEILKEIHRIKQESYLNYFCEIRENVHLFKIIECIHDIYNIALVTTASEKNCFDILVYFNKQNCFDLILTQKDVKLLKPDPEVYLTAMKHFKIKKEDTIIFEDSTEGILAAEKTGATVFIVNQM